MPDKIGRSPIRFGHRNDTVRILLSQLGVSRQVWHVAPESVVRAVGAHVELIFGNPHWAMVRVEGAGRTPVSALPGMRYVANPAVLVIAHGCTIPRMPSTYTQAEMDRFMAMVEKTTTCWFWTGATDPNGYGAFKWRGWKVSSHRWLYKREVRDIPRTTQLDHLCQNRKCVNPSHLEEVTAAENNRRKSERIKSYRY